MIQTVLVTALGGFSLMGCSGSPKPEAEHASVAESAPEPQSVGEAPQCVDDKDQRIQCLSETDCCAGFVCGKDPELSQHVSYCIYGGS